MGEGNMVRVSQDVFFTTIGGLNVHPHLGSQKYDPVIGYKSYWKTPNGKLLGISFGVAAIDKQYWLSPDLRA